MLNKAKTLKGYKLDSLDGEFGEVKEFYFDDWIESEQRAERVHSPK